MRHRHEYDNQGITITVEFGRRDILYTDTNHINEKNISLISQNKLPWWHIVHKILRCQEMSKTNTQTHEQPFHQI